MRGVELDSEDGALLDHNINEAEAAYKARRRLRDPGTGLVRLEGGAIHRLDAVRAPDAIETRLQVPCRRRPCRGGGPRRRMSPGRLLAAGPVEAPRPRSVRRRAMDPAPLRARA